MISLGHHRRVWSFPVALNQVLVIMSQNKIKKRLKLLLAVSDGGERLDNSCYLPGSDSEGYLLVVSCSPFESIVSLTAGPASLAVGETAAQSKL